MTEFGCMDARQIAQGLRAHDFTAREVARG